MPPGLVRPRRAAAPLQQEVERVVKGHEAPITLGGGCLVASANHRRKGIPRTGEAGLRDCVPGRCDCGSRAVGERVRLHPLFQFGRRHLVANAQPDEHQPPEDETGIYRAIVSP